MRDREQRIDEMLARHEIHQVILSLARATDRRDPEAIRSCYHPDAVDDHGAFRGSPAEFADWVPRTLALFAATQHLVGSPRIVLEGARARSETYCQAHHVFPSDDSGGERDAIMALRYVDRFERRDEGPWLIARRTCVWDFTSMVPLGEKWPLADGFLLGSPDRSDPSYSL